MSGKPAHRYDTGVFQIHPPNHTRHVLVPKGCFDLMPCDETDNMWWSMSSKDDRGLGRKFRATPCMHKTSFEPCIHIESDLCQPNV